MGFNKLKGGGNQKTKASCNKKTQIKRYYHFW